MNAVETTLNTYLIKAGDVGADIEKGAVELEKAIDELIKK